MKPAPNLWLEYALLALLALLWGSSYLFIRVAIADIPPITLIAFRVTVAAAILMLIVVWRGEHLPRDRRTWRMLFVQAIFNSIGAWTILAWGQQYIDSGTASVLNSTSPIFVILLTLVFSRHEAITFLKIGGALIGLTGVVLIVGLDAARGLGQQVAGQLAVLAGALLYGAAAIYGKNFTHLPATITAAGTMIWASICLLPLSLIMDRPWTLAPSLQSIVAAFILATACTGGALLIYFRLVKTLGSMGVASQSYLRAGIGVLLGALILGETITPLVGIGLITTIIGVIAINMPTR